MAESQDREIALEAPQPDRITETRDEGGLTLTYRWFTPMHIFFLLFCIVWDGFLYVWYSNALSRGLGASDMYVWFPMVHVAVGICLTYYTLAGLLNHTRIVVAGGEITVWHGPLPWLGNQTLSTADFRQLYREETISTSRRGGRNASYHVSVVTTTNRKLRLVSDVPGADVALYLEQAIETAIGLKDRRVAGEMPK
jgi:hypothetical protein